MSEARIITFRATKMMSAAIKRIMDERNIDQTSVIKLALYHIDTHMRKEETRQRNMAEVVMEMERAAAPEQKSFARFSLTPKRAARMTSAASDE